VCDFVGGELILCFHRDDPAGGSLVEKIRNGQIAHVTLIEDIKERIYPLKVRPQLPYLLYRLRVPTGSELFKINFLNFEYKHRLLDALSQGLFGGATAARILGDSRFHPQIVPNSRLWAAGLPTSGRFSFSLIHAAYKSMLNVGAAAGSGLGRTVAVLDTGLDPQCTYSVSVRKNFVDPAKPNDVDDDFGHGTGVASVIHDVAPDATFVIYKVANQLGHATEWDTLAALVSNVAADVINISLAFGLGTHTCPSCGRANFESRSSVFENVVDALSGGAQDPIIVAAAGNMGLSQLSYPARFGNVVAVESVNSQGVPSSFSNVGAQDQVGNVHPWVFALPGGDDKIPEYVGRDTTSGTDSFGTSFACAYATGLIARLWSDPLHQSKSKSQLLAILKASASTAAVSGYQAKLHGHGLMRL
jgi:hypothetical protein